MSVEDNGHKPTLKLDLDYKRPAPKEGEQERMSDSELSINYIEAAVGSSHPQGLEGQMRRIFARIQRKADEAIESGKYEFELEKAEQDFLRKSFSECKIPSAFAKYFVVLEEEVERATAK